jgi:5-methylcytosine-specific restriction protein A
MLHAARDILARLCEAVAAPQMAAHLFGRGPGGQPRSPKWPAVRRAWLRLHPACEVCGTTRALDVHHVVPFWQDRSRELDPTNLISLCRQHHFTFAHYEDWRLFNPTIRADAADWRGRFLAARGHFA